VLQNYAISRFASFLCALASIMQIGEKHIILETVDSTNNYVAKALDEGKYDQGTAILAHFQHEGKGQRGSAWQSEAGLNLTFSFAVATTFLPLHRHFLLAKAVSIAIAYTIEGLLQSKVHIKWPNDVLVDARKVAGVLIESKYSGQRYSIVGIGLNVNQHTFSEAFKATSLALELGRVMDVFQVFRVLSESLSHWLTLLERQEYATVNQQYNAMLFGYRQWVEFRQSQRNFTGMISAVDEQGVLLVRSRQGHAQTFTPKEIQINY
jgi:BirA family biotin operon repressor/biotin-[acetyl-CoA-carboxylase] ligase